MYRFAGWAGTAFRPLCAPSYSRLFEEKCEKDGARLSQYRQLVKSAPAGAVFLICSRIFGRVHRVVMQPRIRIRQRWIAIPAMLGARPVSHFAAIRRILRRLEKILHAIDCVIQEIGICRSRHKCESCPPTPAPALPNPAPESPPGHNSCRQYSATLWSISPVSLSKIGCG